MPDNDTINVYDIAPDNDGCVHVYILVPGVDHLIGIPLDKALAFAGDLQAEIGRYELPEEAQPRPLSIQARKVLNFVHREIEMNRRVPSQDEIAEYLGVSRRSMPHQRAMKELEKNGWYRPRGGHRDDDWGGTYKRPLAPPFLTRKTPEIGQLRLLPEVA